MIDPKISCDIIKLLDKIYACGYVNGKLEIHFDSVSGGWSLEVHRAYRDGKKRITETEYLSSHKA